MNDQDLTDLFAALAMQGLLASGQGVRNKYDFAAFVFDLAEAMVEERASRTTDHGSGIMAAKPVRKGKKGVA